MDVIYTLINEHKNILLRAERFICRFRYFSPNNTTEFLGIKKTFFTCCQVYNQYDLYTNDILNSNLDKAMKFDKSKHSRVEEYLDNNLQSCIADPNNHNIVNFI
jgi:hypothetical protein